MRAVYLRSFRRIELCVRARVRYKELRERRETGGAQSKASSTNSHGAKRKGGGGSASGSSKAQQRQQRDQPGQQEQQRQKRRRQQQQQQQQQQRGRDGVGLADCHELEGDTAKNVYAGLDPDADWDELWEGLVERGWRSVPGKRERNDFCFLPPGVTVAGPPFRSRVDYFDSFRSVREVVRRAQGRPSVKPLQLRDGGASSPRPFGGDDSAARRRDGIGKLIAEERARREQERERRRGASSKKHLSASVRMERLHICCLNSSDTAVLSRPAGLRVERNKKANLPWTDEELNVLKEICRRDGPGENWTPDCTCSPAVSCADPCWRLCGPSVARSVAGEWQAKATEMANHELCKTRTANSVRPCVLCPVCVRTLKILIACCLNPTSHSSFVFATRCRSKHSTTSVSCITSRCVRAEIEGVLPPQR